MRKYKIISLTAVNWIELSAILGVRHNCTLRVEQLSPQRSDPRNLKAHRIVEWKNFNSEVSKIGRSLRKYSVYIYDKKSFDVESRIGFITVLCHDETNPVNYQGIEIYVPKVSDAPIQELIVSHLNLEIDVKKEWLNKCSSFSHNLKDRESAREISGIVNSAQIDHAVTLMARKIEAKLREMAKLANVIGYESMVATDLASSCFNQKDGKYLPPYPVASQASHGMNLLLLGYFNYIRNAFMHNADIIDIERYNSLGIQYLELSISLYEIMCESELRK